MESLLKLYIYIAIIGREGIEWLSLSCHWALLDFSLIFFFFLCSAWLTDQCAGIDNKGHLLKPTDSKILFLYNNSNHRTKGEDRESNDTQRTKDKS